MWTLDDKYQTVIDRLSKGENEESLHALLKLHHTFNDKVEWVNKDRKRE
jgi:hypothetical protein